MAKRCRLMVELEDGELVGPFCRVGDARRAVDCEGKVRLVPSESDRCDRAWDVECDGELIGTACEVPRTVGRRFYRAFLRSS